MWQRGVAAGCGTLLRLGEGVVLAGLDQVVAGLLYLGRRLRRLLGGVHLSYSLGHHTAPTPHRDELPHDEGLTEQGVRAGVEVADRGMQMAPAPHQYLTLPLTSQQQPTTPYCTS